MNAEHAMKELVIAGYEMAEAQTALNQANKRITEAARKIAAIHAEIKHAAEQAKKKKAK